MAQSITLFDSQFDDVPSILLPKTGGGTAEFTDVTSTTAVASDVANGKTFFLSNGTQAIGTNTDFIVTVSYNDETEKWVPNCTYAALSAAYSAGRTITVDASGNSNNITADGEWDTTTSSLIYHVYKYNSSDSTLTKYSCTFGSTGAAITSTSTYIVPDFATLSKSYTSSEESQSETISIPSGKNGIESVNISISGIGTSYVGSDVDRRSSSDLTVSGSTVLVPSGYYETNASIIVDNSGGTPAGNVSQDSNGYIILDDDAGGRYDPSDATATAADILSPKTAYISGGKVTGQIATKTSANLSASGDTVTVPAGYYASQVTKAVAAGSAGTPTATKGTVSNHSVSVTPSVTNTGGYISGGTKTGTAVTVSASELVSGTKEITANGTGIDVTDYASVDVSVAGGGDSWSFIGKNPVKIQEWSEHTSFKTLGADSWTYTTSATTTLRAVTSLSPTITCDYTNYDYVALFKAKVSYDYGDWSPVAAITDFAYTSVFYSIGYCGTLSAVESATQNSTTYTSSARYKFFYNNSSGVKTIGDSTYGLYSGSAPQVSGTGTSNSMISTFKKPTVSIRGNANYFSETAFNNLDMDNSFYDMKMELWRVDKATSDRAWVEDQIVDLLNNGI